MAPRHFVKNTLMYRWHFYLIVLMFVMLCLLLFSRPKEKQDTYEVMERDNFYKKGKIGKSQHKKPKILEHRLNKL